MTIETTPFRRPLWWFFLAALIMSAVVAYGMALPLGVGAVLGYITERRVDWALGRFKVPDTSRWRALLSAAFMVGLLLVVFLPVGLSIYLALSDLLKLISHTDWGQFIDKIEKLSETLAPRLQELGVDISFDQIRAKATELVTSNVGAAGGIVAGALTSTPDALFNTLIILIGWYVFAVEGREARRELLPRLVPWERPRQILADTTAEVIESVIIANVLVSAVQALVCGVPLLVLRVPRAFVWTLLSFFLSFIPVVGTMPVTLGAALWCYTQGRTGGAIVMVIVAIVVGSVDNVLRPLFMRSSKSADLSTLWLLVALTSGVSAFGLAGVIIGPLSFSLFVAYSKALEPPPPIPRLGEPPPEPLPTDTVPLVRDASPDTAPALPADAPPDTAPASIAAAPTDRATTTPATLPSDLPALASPSVAPARPLPTPHAPTFKSAPVAATALADAVQDTAVVATHQDTSPPAAAPDATAASQPVLTGATMNSATTAGRDPTAAADDTPARPGARARG